MWRVIPFYKNAFKEKELKKDDLSVNHGFINKAGIVFEN